MISNASDLESNYCNFAQLHTELELLVAMSKLFWVTQNGRGTCAAKSNSRKKSQGIVCDNSKKSKVGGEI
jgi:hypothetical protein